MSVETQPKIVTITKEDEAALEAKFNKNEKTLDQTLKPPKQSPLKFNQSKYWPSSKSPEKSKTKFIPKDDVEDSLTREELLTKLAIKIQEEEKEIDLNETSISGANAKMSKSKKDLSKSLIANLDNEFETLKYKRSAAMAERDRLRKEQIKQALDDENEADALRGTFGQTFTKGEKTLKICSTVNKTAYENLQDFLQIHNEKMQSMEKEYEELTNVMVSQITDEVELARLADNRKSGITEEAKKKKENLKNYSKVDPPPSLNSYMTNPFLMKKKRETPKEKKLQQIKNLKKKRDDLKTFKEKFLEYLEDKKEKIERQKTEVPQEGPNQLRQRFNSAGRVSFISERNLDASPTKRQFSQKLDAAYTGTPSREVRGSSSSPMRSVKKLPSRRTSERKAPRSISRRTSVLPPEDEMRRLLSIFHSLKKGEKPTVSKEAIWNYIMKSPQLFENYNLDLMAIRHNLYEFPSEYKNSMAFEEFVAFLRDAQAQDPQIIEKVLNEIEELPENNEIYAETAASRKRKNFLTSVKDERTMHEIQKMTGKFENFCVLSEEKLDLFRQVFNKLSNSDDDDTLVNRLAFAKQIREDESIRKILREAAVYISEYDEYVSLERVLKQIENDFKNAPARLKKSKENVSLAQFLKFFTNYELNKAKGLDEEDDENEDADADDSEEVDIKPDRLQFFKDIFDSIPKDKNNNADKEAFLQYLRDTEYYNAVCEEVARKKAILFDLPAETIAETINRVSKEADASLAWDDFKQFFTRRGRPLKLILSLTDIDGSRHGSKILDRIPQSKDITYKMRLEEALEEEEEEEVDINPTVSLNSKYMSYKREDRDHALNKKAFKAALEAAEQAIQDEEEFERLQQEEEERRKAEELRKKVYGSKFGALYKEGDDYKITEPKPFQFDSRDKNRPKTIRERKVEEMLLEKEQKELEVINVYFKANEVPAHVTTPLFEKIMKAQEDRRRQVKENSIAITKARENPFSFYYRDQNKSSVEPPLNPEFEVRFKAKPAPENTKIRNLWELMQNQEKIERQVRIDKRSKENLAVASIHPRMAQYEIAKKAKEEEEEKVKQAKKEEDAKNTFKANPVPDFEKLQKNFQDLLDAKRKSKKPTKAKGFAFQETRKGVKRDYLDKENQLRKAAKDPNKRDPFEAVERLKAHKPKVQPPTTKKMLAMMDKLKAEREERERRLWEKREEEQRRWEKYHKMKPRVQASPAIVDNARQKAERDMMIKHEIRATMIDNQRRFEEEMRIIYERVEARPLLIEQEGDKNKRLAHQAGREMFEYFDGEGEPRMIDPKYLTPEELAYLQQEGYLRRVDEYGGEVAEEEGEYEEEGQEDEAHHENHEHGHYGDQYEYEEVDEEEEGEEGEEGEEEIDEGQEEGEQEYEEEYES